MSKESLIINSYIVYLTYVVLALALISFLLICGMRSRRRKNAPSKSAFDSTLLTDDDTAAGVSYEGASAVSKSSSSRNSLRIQKAPSSKNKRDGVSGTSSSAAAEKKGDMDDIISQYSSSTTSLLLGEAKYIDPRTEQMSEQMNHTMRMAFASVLDDGITLVQHSGKKGPTEVRLSLLQGRDLELRSRRFFGAQPVLRLRLDLRDVLFIEWGKRTQNFCCSDAAKDVREEICFSLVTEDSTLDFQASSKVERDALVQGFMMKVADLKEVGAKA